MNINGYESSMLSGAIKDRGCQFTSRYSQRLKKSKEAFIKKKSGKIDDKIRKHIIRFGHSNNKKQLPFLGQVTLSLFHFFTSLLMY